MSQQLCESYCTDCRYPFLTMENWLGHLRSALHQSVKRKQGVKKMLVGWGDVERSLLVSGILGIPALEVLQYFTNWGHIQDFSYLCKRDGGTDTCHILMQYKESVDKATQKAVHTIGNKSITLRKIQNRVEKVLPRTNATDPALVTKMKDQIGGKQPNGTFFCKLCDLNIQFNSFWLAHLTSDAHQSKHRTQQFIRKTLWDLDRKVEVTSVSGIKSITILEYLTAKGQVEDFSYLAKNDGNTKCCYAMFQSKEVAEAVAADTAHKVAAGKHIKIKLIENKMKKKWTEWAKKRERNGMDGGQGQLENPLVPVVPLDEITIESSDEEDEKDKNISNSDLPNKISPSKRKLDSPNESCGNQNKVVEEEKLSGELLLLTNILTGKKLEEQIDIFLKEINWSEDSCKQSFELIRQLSDIKAKTIFLKQVQFKTFGSLVTKTGLKSRIHVQLLLDLTEALGKTTESRSSFTNSRVDNFKKGIDSSIKTDVFQPSQVIVNLFNSPEGLTQPELRFTNITKSGVKADFNIRFGNLLPVQESELLEFYCKLDPRVLPLFGIIVYWSTTFSSLIVETELFENQIILFLILTFLQFKKILPTVERLQKASEQPLILSSAGGINIAFCKDLATIPPNEIGMLKDESIRALSILGLLKDFFEFFGKADLDKNAICTRFGLMVPKADFLPVNVGNLPGELCRQYRFGGGKVGDGQRGRFINSETPFCVQDPFDLALNLTKNVTPIDVWKFQKLSQAAAKKVENMMTEDNPNILHLFIKGEEELRIISEALDHHAPSPVKRLKSCLKGQNGSNLSSTSSNKSKTPVGQQNPIPKQIASASSGGSSGDVKVVKVDCAEEEEDEADWDYPDEGEGDIESSLGLNTPLFQYFARCFKGTEEMKFQKLSLLTLQIILDFNSLFFTNCFGLVFEPKVGQKFWPSDFAQMGENGVFTLEERLGQITDDETRINVEFRLRTDKIIHRTLCEPAENLTIKRFAKGRSLTEISWLLYDEEVDGIDMRALKNTILIPVTPENRLEFRGELTGSTVPKYSNGVRLSKLKLFVGSNSNKAANASLEPKIKFIKKLYHKLGQGYINKRIKRWLDLCKDFNRKKADNFQNGMHQRWNAKANRRARRRNVLASAPTQQQTREIPKPLFPPGNSVRNPLASNLKPRGLLGERPVSLMSQECLVPQNRFGITNIQPEVTKPPRGLMTSAPKSLTLIPRTNKNYAFTNKTPSDGPHPFAAPRANKTFDMKNQFNSTSGGGGGGLLPTPRNFQEYQLLKQEQQQRDLSFNSSPTKAIQRSNFSSSAPKPTPLFPSKRTSQNVESDSNYRYKEEKEDFEEDFELNYERRPPAVQSRAPMPIPPGSYSSFGRGRYYDDDESELPIPVPLVRSNYSSNTVGYESTTRPSASGSRGYSSNLIGYSTARGGEGNDNDDGEDRNSSYGYHSRHESDRIETDQIGASQSSTLAWQTREQYSSKPSSSINRNGESYNFKGQREAVSPQQGYGFSSGGFTSSARLTQGMVSPQQLQGYGISPGGYQNQGMMQSHSLSSASSYSQQQQRQLPSPPLPNPMYSGRGGGRPSAVRDYDQVPIYPRRF